MKNITTNKLILIDEIKRLSNQLDSQYNNELNFRNHCYLRIAYDNVVQDKWDNIIKKPFVKFANNNQFQDVIILLNEYSLNKNQLVMDNLKSLEFRKKHKKINTDFQNELFTN